MLQVDLPGVEHFTVIAIATGHRVDHPAKESFIGRELRDGARELRQIGNRRLLLGRAAEFDERKNTQLDPYPRAAKTGGDILCGLGLR